mmetsp:Transcript_61861/g.199482  ORF Transcript_61861/g.199482 Transcript_61861/m.199482 type:complete len:425 (+) Transcript_61861:152-1426(+)
MVAARIVDDQEVAGLQVDLLALLSGNGHRPLVRGCGLGVVTDDAVLKLPVLRDVEESGLRVLLRALHCVEWQTIGRDGTGGHAHALRPHGAAPQGCELLRAEARRDGAVAADERAGSVLRVAARRQQQEAVGLGLRAGNVCRHVAVEAQVDVGIVDAAEAWLRHEIAHQTAACIAGVETQHATGHAQDAANAEQPRLADRQPVVTWEGRRGRDLWVNWQARHPQGGRGGWVREEPKQGREDVLWQPPYCPLVTSAHGLLRAHRVLQRIPQELVVLAACRGAEKVLVEASNCLWADDAPLDALEAPGWNGPGRVRWRRGLLSERRCCRPPPYSPPPSVPADSAEACRRSGQGALGLPAAWGARPMAAGRSSTGLWTTSSWAARNGRPDLARRGTQSSVGHKSWGHGKGSCGSRGNDHRHCNWPPG